MFGLEPLSGRSTEGNDSSVIVRVPVLLTCKEKIYCVAELVGYLRQGRIRSRYTSKLVPLLGTSTLVGKASSVRWEFLFGYLYSISGGSGPSGLVGAASYTLSDPK